MEFLSYQEMYDILFKEKTLIPYDLFYRCPTCKTLLKTTKMYPLKRCPECGQLFKQEYN